MNAINEQPTTRGALRWHVPIRVPTRPPSSPSESVSPTSIAVEAYHAEGSHDAPVRVSYLRYVAEAPVCGYWPTNLADQRDNGNYPNFGCATQRNFAVQVANPGDLVQPRSETARASERRDTVWTKYVKGDTTNTKKSADEKISTKNQD